MTARSVGSLRRSRLDGDADCVTVAGQRRYSIVPEAGADPMHVIASARNNTHWQVVITGGDLVLVAGPFEVRAEYIGPADIIPDAVYLRCKTCRWTGKTRSWRYRRLMIGDAMAHTCVK